MAYKFKRFACIVMGTEPSDEKEEQPVLPPFKTNPLFRDIFPKYSEKQMDSLVKSIDKYGQLHPIFVNGKGEILDGHNTYEACMRRGRAPRYEVKKFESHEEELIFVLDCNLSRRDLNAYQRIEAVVLYREPIERKWAEQRKLSGLKRGDKSPMVQINTYGEEGRLREILAPKAHVGDHTYYMGSWLVKNAPEKEKEQLRKGLIKISRAYAILQSQKKLREKGPFNGEIVKIDPSVMLIRGYLGDIDEATIQSNSLDVIFPSADCSSDKKLLKNIAGFALKSLRKGGFLVLYSKHTSVGAVSNIIRSNAKDLKLVQVLSAPFDVGWLNVDGAPPIESHTAIFLVFWKEMKNYDSDYMFEEFPINPDFEDDEEDESRKELIRASKATLYVVDYILQTLELKPGMTVCDPSCGDGELGLRVAEYELNFVGIENDLEKFQTAKENFQNRDKGSGE